MIITLFILIVLLLIHHLRKNQHLMNPSTIWIFFQSILLIGTLRLVHIEKQMDFYYIFICELGFFMFLIGNTFASIIYPVTLRKKLWSNAPVINNINNSLKTSIWFVLIFCIIINSLYYYLIGYNVFTSGISAILSGTLGSFDASDLRFGTYSGKHYYAPGLVNQFKNFIFPSLVVLIFILQYNYQKFTKRSFVLFVLVALALFFILGTGQRGAFVIISIYSIILIKNSISKAKFKKLIKIIGPIGFCFFLISTFILGRSGITKLDNFNDFLVVIGNAMDRFFTVNQESGLDSFYYVFNKDHSWGYDWLMSFEQFLPGKSKYVSLANQVYNFVYGTFRGTNTPSIWASIWYNFSYAGVVVIAFFMGFFYHVVFCKLLKTPKKISNIYAFAFLVLVLGSWVVGGPDYLVLNGLLVYIFFKVLFNIRVRKKQYHRIVIKRGFL